MPWSTLLIKTWNQSIAIFGEFFTYFNETCDNFLSGEHRREIWICHGQLPPEGSFSFMLDLPLLSRFSTRKIENIYSFGIHGNTKLCNTTLSYLKIYFKFNIYKLEKKKQGRSNNNTINSLYLSEWHKCCKKAIKAIFSSNHESYCKLTMKTWLN